MSPGKKIRTVLIANRGEIAKRLFRACRTLGVRSVAVHSGPDTGSCWCRQADSSVSLPGTSLAETYLSPEAIIGAALEVGADAIHPGYGFLSESPEFAASCEGNGIRFIGPRPEAMRLLGSKARARELAASLGIPVVPGVDGAGRTDEELEREAERIGYPILIKASAGGGGRGMRIVARSDELADSLRAARAEARSAFGSEHLILEKHLAPVRHVEVQLLGDAHGNMLHLLERECSIQRRHQKLIEESPSPMVGDDLRRELTSAAVRLAVEAGYSSAGTAEFLVDADGQHYFLEMNTRLQVEHPVTELATGVDIAAWQIRIAAGHQLDIEQDRLCQRGHAIECRVYAEDPARGFLPSTGTVAIYRPPSGPGVRCDDGISSGSQVTSLYDPLLAKIITTGWNRRDAIRRMRQALSETIVLGITTNIDYLIDVLDHPAFRSGDTTTDFLNDHFAGWQQPVELAEEDWLAIAAFESLSPAANVGEPSNGSNGRVTDPWVMAGGWRNVP